MYVVGGGIEVDPAEIAARGRLMVVAADQVDRLQLAASLSQVEAALPASRAALAVERLASSWRRAEAHWARATTQHGQALLTGSWEHDRTEEAIRRALGERSPDRPTQGPLERRGVR